MAYHAALDPVVLRVFHHHLYEYRRGVRSLFLMTMSGAEARPVLTKLGGESIACFVQQVGEAKVNLFFGQAAFVAVARAFVTRPLNELSPEEDFMLGTLLGYDKEQQCRRFLTKISGRAARPDLAEACALP